MKLFIISVFLCSVLISIVLCEDEQVKKTPSVVIVTLIRNKAHILPYFLTYLQEQNYPKDRISLW